MELRAAPGCDPRGRAQGRGQQEGQGRASNRSRQRGRGGGKIEGSSREEKGGARDMMNAVGEGGQEWSHREASGKRTQ